ncbi:AAA family ATPase [Sulfobacillus thermosulfidooxidans]|uniref:AAA family ATPase n=1 Tax=Sulfobacillus thermosulfidooxidans TaxID=28034 RepID=UPI00096B8120|nr:MoxR family ATPase [Sulfobacillus thermosulfidooxidans]OLZ09180.1 magnesium chelatase [Sulfobacillus thermosulfidooxidans]OLZ17745.1 magnesium chelatase [Sulfobacillus thermosulfidooxidans]OLZ22290.1 magnesium chelatase [Sulfobacillus thermosulfidooxidans]
MTPASLLDKLEEVVIGKRQQAVWLLVALVAGGHVLIEDVPGVAKTRLVKALAQILQLSFSRIQATPDLLPSDITGGMVYEPSTQSLQFRPGPIFHQMVLVDEINRATPRSQSALLESMEESQVSVDGTTYPLPEPFMLVATANPVEMAGTFPLPEAQKDRFLLSFAMGYPTLEEEQQMAYQLSHADPANDLIHEISADEVLRWRQEADSVQVSRPINDYIVGLVRATRSHPQILLGASPRAVVQWIRALKAYAWIKGQTFCTPDDVQALMPVILGHRLIIQGGPRQHVFDERQRVLREILKEIQDSVVVPVESLS